MSGVLPRKLYRPKTARSARAPIDGTASQFRDQIVGNFVRLGVVVEHRLDTPEISIRFEREAWMRVYRLLFAQCSAAQSTRSMRV